MRKFHSGKFLSNKISTKLMRLEKKSRKDQAKKLSLKRLSEFAQIAALFYPQHFVFSLRENFNEYIIFFVLLFSTRGIF